MTINTQTTKPTKAPAIATLREMLHVQREVVRLIRQAQGAINTGGWTDGEEKLSAALIYVQAVRRAGGQ